MWNVRNASIKDPESTSWSGNVPIGGAAARVSSRVTLETARAASSSRAHLRSCTGGTRFDSQRMGYGVIRGSEAAIYYFIIVPRWLHTGWSRRAVHVYLYVTPRVDRIEDVS